LPRERTWTTVDEKATIDPPHGGAFLAIAGFAVACTMLSALVAGAQTGSGLTTVPGAAPPPAPGATPTPGVVTPSSGTPMPGTLTTTPANATTPAATPAPRGTMNCAPAAAGCAPGTTPPPNGLNPQPSTAYPINPPAGNGQPG
jgi:hypothetical protein